MRVCTNTSTSNGFLSRAQQRCKYILHKSLLCTTSSHSIPTIPKPILDARLATRSINPIEKKNELKAHSELKQRNTIWPRDTGGGGLEPAKRWPCFFQILIAEALFKCLILYSMVSIPIALFAWNACTLTCA